MKQIPWCIGVIVIAKMGCLCACVSYLSFVCHFLGQKLQVAAFGNPEIPSRIASGALVRMGGKALKRSVLLAVLGRCCLPGKTQKHLHVLLGRALWESFIDFLGCRFRHHLRTCTNFVKALRFMRAIVGCAFSQGYQSK